MVKTLTVFLAFVMASAMPACKNPFSAAWRTTDAVRAARNLTAQQLAAAAQAKHKECKEKHGAKTSAFAECIAKHREALAQWQKNVRPAVNSAIQVTATALQIAEKAKAKKNILTELSCCRILSKFSRASHSRSPNKDKLTNILKREENLGLFISPQYRHNLLLKNSHLKYRRWSGI